MKAAKLIIATVLLLLCFTGIAQSLFVSAFPIDLPDCHDSTATFKAFPYGASTTPTYQWSNGSTNDTVSGLLPGTYTVTMTSTNPVGIAIDTFTVYAWATTTITTWPECNHTQDGWLQVEYQSVKAPVLVDWYRNGVYNSNFNYNQSAFVQLSSIQHGNYTAYVTDADGCHDTLDVVVAENTPIDYFHIYLSDSTLCCGDTSLVWFSPPGLPLYNSPFTSSDTLTVMNMCSHLYYPDGYYTVDSFGCGGGGALPITYYQMPPTYAWEYEIFTNADGAFYVNSGNSSSFQWYYNNNPIAGADSNVYMPTQAGSYHVVETNLFGCTKYYAPETFTSVSNTLLTGIKIFPNPVSDLLFINSDKPIAEVEVVDALGKAIPVQAVKSNANEYFIPVKKLTAGRYTLRLGEQTAGFIKTTGR
ncbi:MAG: T9SS type A sorting domain-containing protein [Chitinophagales bacterium]